MASQPLALDLPARKISSSSSGRSGKLGSSLTTWAAAGGACRLHSTLALGCALPLMLFTAASILAAPLSSSSTSSVSPMRSNGGKTNQNSNSNAPLSATATLAVAALAAAPAIAAQAALAWAPRIPVDNRVLLLLLQGQKNSTAEQQYHQPRHHHLRSYGWKDAALGICEPGTGGSNAADDNGIPSFVATPCACRYSLAQLAALALTAAIPGTLLLARAAGAAASAALNRRLSRRLRLVQLAGPATALLYASLAAATRLLPADRWPAETARGATAAAAAAIGGVLVVCLVLAPVAAASAARRAEERRRAAVEGGVEGGGGGGGESSK